MSQSTYYSIRHVTRFRYSSPISESMMEARMRPRSEAHQRCISFELTVSPKARVMQFEDYQKNAIHTFDIPAQHIQLVITARAIVEMGEFIPPTTGLTPESWAELDSIVQNSDYWDSLLPTPRTTPTDLLNDMMRELNITRRDDPLTVLCDLNAGLYNTFKYTPKSTDVDSPIDDALKSRQGVCQDFAHIMITMVRSLGIPCRYVSGYLFHRRKNRSAEDATHAWVEAFLPQFGWVGFDPTNNLMANGSHIRAAVGRDYSDVPPTKGVFKGKAETELSVAVQVIQLEKLPDEVNSIASMWSPPEEETVYPIQQQQQQQQ